MKWPGEKQRTTKDVRKGEKCLGRIKTDTVTNIVYYAVCNKEIRIINK